MRIASTLAFLALLLLGASPASAQALDPTTPACRGSAAFGEALDHYFAEVDETTKLFVVFDGAQALNVALAKVNGAAAPPVAAAVLALVTDDASVIVAYVFDPAGCTLAHGTVDAQTWTNAVADAHAILREITASGMKPGTLLFRRDGA